jgi:hypothetical protein
LMKSKVFDESWIDEQNDKSSERQVDTRFKHFSEFNKASNVNKCERRRLMRSAAMDIQKEYVNFEAIFEISECF